MRHLRSPRPRAAPSYLMTQLIEAAVRDGLVADAQDQVSVVGAGAIGTAAADLLLDAGIVRRVADDRRQRRGPAAGRASCGTVTAPAASPGGLGSARRCSASAVVLSAVTSPLDLDVIDPDRALDLEGTLLIDDSVPGQPRSGPGRVVAAACSAG